MSEAAGPATLHEARARFDITFTPPGGPPAPVTLADIRPGTEWFRTERGFGLVHLIVVNVGGGATNANADDDDENALAEGEVLLHESYSRDGGSYRTFPTREKALSHVTSYKTVITRNEFERDVNLWVMCAARGAPAAEASTVARDYRSRVMRNATARGQRPAKVARRLLRPPPRTTTSDGVECDYDAEFVALASTLEVVACGDSRVVHGHGVVARRALRASESLRDPLVRWCAGKVPADQRRGDLWSERVLQLADGFFSLRDLGDAGDDVDGGDDDGGDDGGDDDDDDGHAAESASAASAASAAPAAPPECATSSYEVRRSCDGPDAPWVRCASQKEAAAKIGVSISSVNRYLNQPRGNRVPGRDAINGWLCRRAGADDDGSVGGGDDDDGSDDGGDDDDDDDSAGPSHAIATCSAEIMEIDLSKVFKMDSGAFFDDRAAVAAEPLAFFRELKNSLRGTTKGGWVNGRHYDGGDSAMCSKLLKLPDMELGFDTFEELAKKIETGMADQPVWRNKYRKHFRSLFWTTPAPRGDGHNNGTTGQGRSGDRDGDNGGDGFSSDDGGGAAAQWRDHGSVWIGRRIERAVAPDETDTGERVRSAARVVGWLAADVSNFTSERTGAAAALWRVVYEDGPLAGEEEELEVRDVERTCHVRVASLHHYLGRKSLYNDLPTGVRAGGVAAHGQGADDDGGGERRRR